MKNQFCKKMKMTLFVWALIMTACQPKNSVVQAPAVSEKAPTPTTSSNSANSSDPDPEVEPDPALDLNQALLQVKITNLLQENLDRNSSNDEIKVSADQYFVEISYPANTSKNISIERSLIQDGNVISQQMLNLASAKARDGGQIVQAETLDLSQSHNLSPVTVTYKFQMATQSREISNRVLRNEIIDGRVDLNETPVFNSALATSGNPIIEMDHVVFLKHSLLVTEGKSFSLKIKNLVILDNASVLSFEKDIPNGLSGGDIHWTAEEASGELHVNLHAQKGAPGADGLARLPQDRPTPGAAGNAFWATHTRYAPRCAEYMDCPVDSKCVIRQAGQDGTTGFQGLQGGSGFPGGNGGNFVVHVDKPAASFSINFLGTAGSGGDPGQGGDGGLPGDPGPVYDAQNWCLAPAGHAGVNGPKGLPGSTGSDGKPGSYTQN
jgi:hypothetical protein